MKTAQSTRFTRKGVSADPQIVQQVRALLASQGFETLVRDELIEYAHVLSDTFKGISEAHLLALASLLRLGVAEVFETLSFYHHFRLLGPGELPPAVIVRVCDGLSCQMSGATPLLSELQTAYAGRTDVAIDAVPCIGRCEQGPAACVGHTELGFASLHAIERCVRLHVEGEWGGYTPAVQTTVQNASIPLSDYLNKGGFTQLGRVVTGQVSGEEVIQTLSASGLRGLGGAGFPVGRKWSIVRQYEGPRLMAVNIDEGEPGTFKDRTYIEQDVFRFVEGMLIAAHVVGIEACYVYIRDEYHAARRDVLAALKLVSELFSADLPVKPVSVPPDLNRYVAPRLILRRGAGAYICGEESAMIESIEGKRGEPRLRPPYIAQTGLFGRPTLEHNFETLFWVPTLLEKGAAWFTSFGRRGRTGLRSFSVSGRVKNPGVKLAPAGITVTELIHEYCGGMQDGHALYAYFPGGASGGILPAKLADIPLDFDTLTPYGCFIGSAAVIVLSQHDRARDAALQTMRFFKHESCGQCTPCRVGTDKAAHLMQQPVWDMQTLDALSQVMTEASICGLGQAAPNPIRCMQQYFRHEVDGTVTESAHGVAP